MRLAWVLEVMCWIYPAPTNSHHQDDYNFHKGIPIIKAFKNATVTGLAVDPSVMLFCLVKFIFEGKEVQGQGLIQLIHWFNVQ